MRFLMINMNILLDSIDEDIDWRISQIILIRKLPTKSTYDSSETEFLVQNAVPILYSLWEGFLKNTYEFIDDYIIRKLRINKNYFDNDLYITTYVLDKKCKFKFGREDIGQKVKHVEKLFKLIDSPTTKKSKRYDGTTFNYKNTCKMLSIFEIEGIDSKYESDLDDFLKKRNRISHGDGDRFIRIEKDELNNFANLVIDLMYDVSLNVEKKFSKFS